MVPGTSRLAEPISILAGVIGGAIAGGIAKKLMKQKRATEIETTVAVAIATIIGHFLCNEAVDIAATMATGDFIVGLPLGVTTTTVEAVIHGLVEAAEYSI
jgi:uncharacterized membrane protein YeaQ/YmgE (transglycosylase-associated protein family)